MPMPIRWLQRNSTLMFADQSTSYTTAATSGFQALLVGTDVSVDFHRDKTDLQLLEGQAGSRSFPSFGGKHGGQLKCKAPLRALFQNYDPTMDTITGKVSPELLLLASAMGCGASNALATIAYVLGGSSTGIGAASTSTSIVTASGSYTVGAALVTGTTSATNIGRGFIKSSDGATPPTLTMEEAVMASPGTPANHDTVFPSATLYLSAQQQVPKTFRYVGSDVKSGVILIGAICKSVTLDLPARGIPMIEFDYVFTSHQPDPSQAIGGLVVPTAANRLPPSIGVNGARLTYDGAVKDGLSNLKIVIENSLMEVESANAAQGVSEIITTERAVKVTFELPYDGNDVVVADGTDQNNIHEASLINGTQHSLQMLCGTAVGRLAGFYLPSLRYVEVPKLKNKNGAMVYEITAEAGTCLQDGSPTAVDAPPADSVFRIFVA